MMELQQRETVWSVQPFDTV